MKDYSPYQFAIARILTGFMACYAAIYILSHWLSFHVEMNLTGYTRLMAATVGITLGVTGVFLILGLLRRVATMVSLTAIGIWIMATFLNPEDSKQWIGVATLAAILLVTMLAPPGEALRIPLTNRFESQNDSWRFPRWLSVFALVPGVAVGLFVLLSEPNDLYGPALVTIGILLFTGLNLTWILPSRPAHAKTEPQTHPIVFFDGVCGLCNTAVDFILAEDRSGIFRYAPLQGETAAQLLSPVMVADMDSMVFQDATGTLYTRSDAILRIGVQMGGLWQLGAPALLIPRPLRNALYNLIARNRYRWFGKKESCRMPTPRERELFLM